MASPRDLVEVEVDKEAQARLILPAPNTNLEEASIAYRSSTCGDWIGRRAALTRLTSLALSRDESSDLALHTFPLPKIAAVHVTPGQWAQTPSQKQMTHVAAPTGMDFDAALQRCKHFFDHEMMRDHACSDITPSNPTIAECHSEQDRRERALARDRVRWMQAAEEEAECVQGVLHVARQRKRDIPRVRSEVRSCMHVCQCVCATSGSLERVNVSEQCGKTFCAGVCAHAFMYTCMCIGRKGGGGGAEGSGAGANRGHLS